MQNHKLITGKIKFAEIQLETMAGDPETEFRYYWKGGDTVGFSKDWHEMYMPNLKPGDTFSIGPFKLRAIAWHGFWLQCNKIGSEEEQEYA